MITYRACLASWLLVAGCCLAWADDRPANNAGTLPPWSGALLHKAWTREDGAPSSAYEMVQDGNGVLWLAASDGLYTFDGARFVRQERVYGHPLQSPTIISVAAYGETIWVTYQFGGISRFDRDAVRHYLPGQDAPEGSAHWLVRMANGTMWTSTSRGLHRLDRDRWRPVQAHEGLPPSFVPQMRLLRDGRLIVMAKDGLYRSIEADRTGRYRFAKVLHEPGIVGNEPLRDGRLLILTQDNDMQILDLATGQRTGFRPQIGPARILSYSVDERGGIWISNQEGLLLLDGEGKLVGQFGRTSGFSSTTLSHVMTDREGNIWFATAAGIDRVRQARLTTVDGASGPTGLLSVTPDAGGAVWINDFASGSPIKSPSIRLTLDGKRHQSAMQSISSSHRAANGTLWFANNATVWRVRDGVTRSWPLPPSLAGNNVQSMTTDASGKLWLSVIRSGVHTLDDGVWRAGDGNPDLAGPTAIVLATDRQGRIWFGYPRNRIGVLDKGILRYLGPGDGLDIGNTLSIVAGRDRVWLGGDRGLAWFDGQRVQALRERGSNGFRGVSGIVARANGELWLHDTGGLARIEPAALERAGPGGAVAAERFDHLDGHRGMAAQLQPLPSLVQADGGRIWYATSTSVGHIDPDAIMRNARPPTVLVEAIRTDRRQYLPGPEHILPPGTRRLEIDYTATALTMPERVKFRYRLVGQDEGWRDAGGPRKAVYTNLAPGAYRFEVLAANEDGVWSPQPARAAFRIEPGFTQTAWFRLACAVVVLAAAWLLHRWRLRRVAARLREHLTVRMLERQRIARTLHDTFLQSVQALVLRMHALMGKLPSDSGARTEVENVLERAEDVIEEGRQRVRQLRVPAVRHGCLLQALEDTGRGLAASSGVAFVQDVTGKPRELDPEIEDELFTIGREALSNAFHHAQATRVVLALDYGVERLRLAVSDDGRGIAPEILASGARQGHWGLPGMRERARLAGAELEIDSTAAGTSVSICIPVTTAYQGMRHA